MQSAVLSLHTIKKNEINYIESFIYISELISQLSRKYGTSTHAQQSYTPEQLQAVERYAMIWSEFILVFGLQQRIGPSSLTKHFGIQAWK